MGGDNGGLVVENGQAEETGKEGYEQGMADSRHFLRYPHAVHKLKHLLRVRFELLQGSGRGEEGGE